MPEMERRLVVNEDVFRSDTIGTEPSSAVRLVFRDQTYLSMGPGSRVRLANLPVAQDNGQPLRRGWRSRGSSSSPAGCARSAII